MSLAQYLSTYVTLNIIITVSYLTLYLSRLLIKDRSSQSELKLHYFVLTGLLTITFIHPFLPKLNVFQPVAKVWSAQSIKTFPNEYTAPDKGGYIKLPGVNRVLEADHISYSIIFISGIILLVGLRRILKDLNCLVRIRKNSFLIRKLGQISIFVNDEISVPFSFWVPFRHDVVIPSSLMVKPTDFKTAIFHELQHHKQLDTKWVYIICTLRIICILNPFIHLWSRLLFEVQEFACDEAIIGRNKVQSQQYARCLIEVAETALKQKYVPVCATGLIFLTESNLLKRRIEKMLSKSKDYKKAVNFTVGSLLMALISTVAFASQGLVQDRRVSLADAQSLAEKTQHNSDFPVVVNDLVLKQLNRYIGTPEGRDFMRNSLQRMANYRSMIESKLNEYQVPNEILAVPIVESGYQNLEESNKKGWGAGIWMFITRTARVFGLRVDDKVDDRLDATLLTDAAMRYLKSERLRFNSWHLALLSYNMGGEAVQKAIDKTGSRDAWTLVRNGFENDKDYLPKVMAAIIIMNNPNTVE